MRRFLPTWTWAVCLAAGTLATAATLSAAPEPAASPSPTVKPAPGGKPHPSPESVKQELRAVIDGQLAAFRADDYAKAYTFAAAEIREIFPADTFEKMVRTAYPVIAKSTASEYGVAFNTDDEAVVNVRVQDAGKRSVEYQYLLKKEAGGWKISGVSEVKSEGLSV